MNPYDFAPVDWTRPPQRRAALPHDRFAGLNGRLEATLTAETPLFVKQGNTDRFFTRNGQPAIPATGLKGLFRSVVETMAQGCFWFCAKPDQLPDVFRPCFRPEALCPACRLFGLINGNTLRLGNVGFDDATCTHAEPHAAMYTAILSNPKPHHEAFYMAGGVGGRIAGRKFYFHHHAHNLLTALGWLPHNAPLDRRQNQHIRPLGPGSAFRFAVVLNNVQEDDFAALLYALTLEPTMRHKLGYAKPCGLGTVHVKLTRLVVRDLDAHYRQGAGVTSFEEDALQAEVERRVAPFVATIPVATLTHLRRIWQWPPPPGAVYNYPTKSQFNAHPGEPISSTDTW